MAKVTNVDTRDDLDLISLDCGKVITLPHDETNSTLVGSYYACPEHPDKGCPEGAQGFYSYVHGDCPTGGERNPASVNDSNIGDRLNAVAREYSGPEYVLTTEEIGRLNFLKWRLDRIIEAGVTGDIPNGEY